jgi:hypothetical protein
MDHKIIDAKWTPQVNMYVIKCGKCLAIFDYRCDRWTFKCPTCGSQGSTSKLRDEWFDRNYKVKL